MLESARSRNALGSGVSALPWLWFWRELKELFTLPPGVEFCAWGTGPGRLLSTPPPTAGAGGAWPWEEVISLVAAGRALVCCLFFFPKRKDMASVYCWSVGKAAGASQARIRPAMALPIDGLGLGRAREAGGWGSLRRKRGRVWEGFRRMDGAGGLRAYRSGYSRGAGGRRMSLMGGFMVGMVVATSIAMVVNELLANRPCEIATVVSNQCSRHRQRSIKKTRRSSVETDRRWPKCRCCVQGSGTP